MSSGQPNLYKAGLGFLVAIQTAEPLPAPARAKSAVIITIKDGALLLPHLCAESERRILRGLHARSERYSEGHRPSQLRRACL
jgi:hypothetical protein